MALSAGGVGVLFWQRIRQAKSLATQIQALRDALNPDSRS